MSSDAPRLVSWLACKTSKAEVILVSCGLTHPLWQRRPRLTGPRRTGTRQSPGHPMSYLSLNGSPGLPMATQLFCGFQCSPVTAAVAPPASPFSFLLLPPLPLWSVLVDSSHVFRDDMTLHKEDQSWLYSPWKESQRAGVTLEPPHCLLGVLHRTGPLHDQKLIFYILWGSIF